MEVLMEKELVFEEEERTESSPTTTESSPWPPEWLENAVFNIIENEVAQDGEEVSNYIHMY